MSLIEFQEANRKVIHQTPLHKCGTRTRICKQSFKSNSWTLQNTFICLKCLEIFNTDNGQSMKIPYYSPGHTRRR